MKIGNIGYHFQHEGTFSINRPHGSGDYMLLLLKSSAFFQINGQKISASADSVILYRKGTPQFYGATGDLFVNDWIHFDMDESDLLHIHRLQIPFDSPLHMEDTTFFSQIIKSMYQERYSINPHREETLQLYFQLLLLKISEGIQAMGSDRPSPHYNKMGELRAKIYRKPWYPWTIQKLSQELMFSPSYFQHLYKEFFGTSPISDVITSRLEHGKYLLSSTDHTISTIAKACGYKNDVQFMRQFKTYTHMTPSEYRRRFRIHPEEIDESKPPYSIL